MQLMLIIVFGIVAILLMIGVTLFGIALKTFDGLLLKFLEINQNFYVNQNNLVKNQQYLTNKAEENISHLSLILKSINQLEAINRDLKSSINQIKLSNIKNTNLLKEVNHGEKTYQKPDHGNQGNPERAK